MTLDVVLQEVMNIRIDSNIKSNPKVLWFTEYTYSFQKCDSNRSQKREYLVRKIVVILYIYEKYDYVIKGLLILKIKYGSNIEMH